MNESNLHLPDSCSYRTASGEEVIVFDAASGKPKLMSFDAGRTYYEVAQSNDSTTNMHVHVPGLNILVGVLRKFPESDSCSLSGLDDLFPNISEQLFMRTAPTYFDGAYFPLPDLVPTAALLAQDPEYPTEYILALQLLGVADWWIFQLEGDLYDQTNRTDDSITLIGTSGFNRANGVIGGRLWVTRYGSAGVADVTFQSNNRDYVLANSPFDNTGPKCSCDGVPMLFVDPEQFAIAVNGPAESAHVQLRPLPHAQRP